MKITDVNLTLGGKDHSGREIDLAYLLSRMEEYRIHSGVCYHQHALLDPKDGNCKMAQLAAHSNGKLHICAVLDPILGADNLPGEGTLQERLAVFKPACLRIFPAFVRLPFHAFYWQEILEAADCLGLPLLVDCEYTDDFFCNLPDISAQYPNVKFILIRQGCCQGRRILPLLQKRKNVYFTIERMVDHLQLEELEEKCGCENLLFGTGFPERPHAGTLGLVLYANISQENRERILYKNWEEMCK